MVAVVISDNSTGRDYTGTEDNALREGSPTQNRGSNAIINVNKIAAGNHWHTLLSFSGISNLPSTITVSSAVVSLYLNAASGSTSQTHTLRRILLNWGELTSNWNTHDGTLTWNTGGCLGADSDRSSTTSDTITGVTNTTGTYYNSNDSAQIRTDVENFASGAVSNYGWHVERTDAANDAETRDYSSSDGTDGQRPKLLITYTAGATEQIPNGTLTLTTFAPTATVSTTGTTEQIPSGSLNLTGFAPNRIIRKVEQIPNGSILLNGFAPTTLVNKREPVTSSTITLNSFAPSLLLRKVRLVPNGTLNLNSFAPTTYLGSIIKSVPSGFLRLTSYPPSIKAFVEKAVRAGGGPKPFSKRVIVNGQRYQVSSYTELRSLLSTLYKEKDQELVEVQVKTPTKKKKIKVLQSQLKNIETELAKADDRWKTIQMENEEILLLLAG